VTHGDSGKSHESIFSGLTYQRQHHPCWYSKYSRINNARYV